MMLMLETFTPLQGVNDSTAQQLSPDVVFCIWGMVQYSVSIRVGMFFFRISIRINSIDILGSGIKSVVSVISI